jgi:hypothetical protein
LLTSSGSRSVSSVTQVGWKVTQTQGRGASGGNMFVRNVGSVCKMHVTNEAIIKAIASLKSSKYASFRPSVLHEIYSRIFRAICQATSNLVKIGQ